MPKKTSVMISTLPHSARGSLEGMSFILFVPDHNQCCVRALGVGLAHSGNAEAIPGDLDDFGVGAGGGGIRFERVAEGSSLVKGELEGIAARQQRLSGAIFGSRQH